MAERPLPQDPDIEVDETSAGMPLAPPHMRPGLIALVFIGGALGSLARYALTSLIGGGHSVPVGTLTVNLVGSFCLGALLETLAIRGSDAGRRRAARLLLGTGFLGGFTTYSAFAVESVHLAGDNPLLAAVWSAGSVAMGAIAALVGIVASRRLARQEAR